MNLPIYKLIDLTTGEVVNYPISRMLFEQYLGGKIMAGKLLLDLQPKSLPRFHPESVLIINTSPANGTGAPSSSRFNMTFKNILTGGIASSNCGGTFGISMKAAGIDGLIIIGKAKNLTLIEVLDGAVYIKSCPQATRGGQGRKYHRLRPRSAEDDQQTAREDQGESRLHDLPGSHDRAQPGHDGGQPDRRGA